jgi:flagellar protein FliO/FliZ
MQRAISVIGVMLVLILGCFVAVKRYAQKGNKKNTGMEIKFLTQHYLGPKKSLAVIRVAGESILIGMTEHNISHIKTLSLLDEDIPQDVAKDFDQELSKSVRLSAQKKAESPAENEDFSFSGIKDIVSSRLKNMRSLE